MEPSIRRRASSPHLSVLIPLEQVNTYKHSKPLRRHCKAESTLGRLPFADSRVCELPPALRGMPLRMSEDK